MDTSQKTTLFNVVLEIGAIYSQKYQHLASAGENKKGISRDGQKIGKLCERIERMKKKQILWQLRMAKRV